MRTRLRMISLLPGRRHLVVGWFAMVAATSACGPSLGQAPKEEDVVRYLNGSTRKVCQLTGDFDRQFGQPTLNKTETRFGVVGTDLGSSFEHDGKLYFLFGDTWGRPGLRDAVAWTTSADPEHLDLHFLTAPDGRWQPLTVPGVSLGVFEVPSCGVSVNGAMYVVVTTDHTPERTMGRSVLAVSRDDGTTFTKLYDLSTMKFINVALCKVGEWLYVFGSGEYRASSVCLARIEQAEMEHRESVQYFVGTGAEGAPLWTAAEGEAVTLFQHNVVGELSVAYCEPLGRYLLLYNSTRPRGIAMRSAKQPWGPWSEATVVFGPGRDAGYGHFMHAPGAEDAVSDPGREQEWGGEYGPYLIPRFFTGDQATTTIFYTMSTWNPYQVVLMRTDLRLPPTAGQTP